MKVIRGVNVFPTQVETALLSMGGGVAPHYMMIVDRENNLDVLTVEVRLMRSTSQMRSVSWTDFVTV